MTAALEDWDGEPFHGAKIALVGGGLILTHLRDDIAGIPFPGRWDLPGGGREGAESPAECAVRETFEEYGLTLDPGSFRYARRQASGRGARIPSWFFGAPLPPGASERIRFGDEGQYWRLMPVGEFLVHPLGIGRLQARVRRCLAAMESLGGAA